jgi:hypothetical protein
MAVLPASLCSFEALRTTVKNSTNDAPAFISVRPQQHLLLERMRAAVLLLLACVASSACARSLFAPTPTEALNAQRNQQQQAAAAAANNRAPVPRRLPPPCYVPTSYAPYQVSGWGDTHVTVLAMKPHNAPLLTLPSPSFPAADVRCEH